MAAKRRLHPVVRLLGVLVIFTVGLNVAFHSKLPDVLHDDVPKHHNTAMMMQRRSDPAAAAVMLLPHDDVTTTKTTRRKETTTTTGADNDEQEQQRQSWPKFWKSDKSVQVVQKDKKGNALYHGVTNLSKEALKGIISSEDEHQHITFEEARKGREELIRILREAGVVEMDAQVIAQLPTWKEVTWLYGDAPVVYGLETCPRFRDTIPPDDASVAVAGLFNTGTNPLAMYLAANCIMPNNTHDRAGHGMRWQVPWGKHMLASRKWNNTAGHDGKVNKTNVLPVVLIRDPYSWMQSMCKHPYAASWAHDDKQKRCPNLVPTPTDFASLDSGGTPKDATSFQVHVHYPIQPAVFDSLVDFWSGWYNEYLRADYPRLIVRFEDLIFHQRQLIATICHCAGAVPKTDAFQYVVGEGKWGGAHKQSSNLISAMIKYGKADDTRLNNLTPQDMEWAKQHVDPNLMHLFHYRQP